MLTINKDVGGSVDAQGPSMVLARREARVMERWVYRKGSRWAGAWLEVRLIRKVNYNKDHNSKKKQVFVQIPFVSFLGSGLLH